MEESLEFHIVKFYGKAGVDIIPSKALLTLMVPFKIVIKFPLCYHLYFRASSLFIAKISRLRI